MELNEARDKLVEYFKSAEQLSEEKEEELIARVPDFLTVEEGKACLDRYNQRTNQYVRLSFSDMLLLSLVNDVPDRADMIMEAPKLHDSGVQFKYPPKTNAVGSGRVTRIVKFKKEIAELLNLAVLPRQMNITDLKQISSNYYREIIHNVKIIKRNMFNVIQEHGLISKESITDLEKHQAYPLYEASSGEDLVESTALNVRNLLAAIFKDQGDDFFNDVEYVFFYHDALFFIKNDEVQSLEANGRYRRFFYLDGGGGPEELNPKTKILVDPGSIGQKVIIRFHDAIRQRIIELYSKQGWCSDMEDLAYNSKEKYGVELYLANLREREEFRDPKIVQLLSELMSDLSPMLSKYFSYMFVQNRHREIKHDDPQALKGYMVRFRQKLMTPAYANKVLTGKVPHSNSINEVDSLSIEELVALKNAGNNFLPQIYARLLTAIFSKIVRYKEFQEVLNDFKSLFSPSDLQKQVRASRQYGFRPNDPETEKAILLNYFVNYGSLYLLERHVEEGFSKVPPKFEAFFQKHLLTHHKSLPKEGNE